MKTLAIVNQKGGCGKGGESKTINMTTAQALKKKGAVEFTEMSYPTNKYDAVI